eukprot:683142-Rhodomonas_salina.16
MSSAEMPERAQSCVCKQASVARSVRFLRLRGGRDENRCEERSCSGAVDRRSLLLYYDRPMATCGRFIGYDDNQNARSTLWEHTLQGCKVVARFATTRTRQSTARHSRTPCFVSATTDI